MKARLQSFFRRLAAWREALSWPQLALGAAAAIILAVMGQIVLMSATGLLLGVVLYAAGGGIFVMVAGATRNRPEPKEEERMVIRRYVPAFLFGLASLALLAYSILHLENYQEYHWQNYLTLAGWLLSIILFCVAVLTAIRWHPASIQSLARSMRSQTGEVILVTCLLLVAFGLRVYELSQYPYPILKDESQLGVEVLNILHGKLTNLFQLGWAGDPLLSSLPEIITVGLFGNTVIGIRLASAVIGALSVVFLYFLARAMFDRLVAILAALSLLALPPHLHFSRLGVNNVVVCFWAAVVLWLTYRALQKGRPADYLWAGLVIGLPLYSYLGSRLISALAVGMILHTILTKRGYLRSQWRNLLILFLALSVVAAPTSVFFFHHPDAFLIRFRSDNIFTSHWLISEPVNSGRSIPAALLDQFRKSTLVFISDSAWGGFYNSPKPYLPIVGAIAFVLGLAYSLSHMRELRHLLLQVWLWAVVIFGSVIFAVPPSNERLVGSLPAVAIITALGLAQTAELLKRVRLTSPRLVNALAVGLMVLAAIQGAYFYLVEYQQQRYFAHPYEEFEVEVSQYLHALGPDNSLYLLVAPPLEATYFPAHDYLIPEIPVQSLAAANAETLAALPRDTGLVFVSIPERKTELEDVARLLPGGQWLEVPRQPVPGQPDQMLYYSYRLAAASAAGP